ncbi:MAG TPA: hypothetical protein VFQ38_05485 [Longimicrobiales bacterium]|nr:hypothetical protein [Longimicrobiales bacterium]
MARGYSNDPRRIVRLKRVKEGFRPAPAPPPKPERTPPERKRPPHPPSKS